MLLAVPLPLGQPLRPGGHGAARCCRGDGGTAYAHRGLQRFTAHTLLEERGRGWGIQECVVRIAESQRVFYAGRFE